MLETISSVAGIVTPILIIGLSAIGWKIKNSAERRAQLEDKMRDDQVKIYHKILTPFFMAFTTDAAWAQDPEWGDKDKGEVLGKILLSQDYKNTTFQFGLIGSDGAVKAYNNLMQYFYSMQAGGITGQDGKDRKNKELIVLMGNLLLEIRKSMGHPETALNNWDMLEGFITDARTIQNR